MQIVKCTRSGPHKNQLGILLDYSYRLQLYDIRFVDMPRIRLALKDTEFKVVADEQDTETLFGIMTDYIPEIKGS